MAAFEVIRFGNAAELANTAATEFLKQLEAAADNTAPFLVALSGGRIAGTFFSATARLAGGKQVPSNVHFFWGDERCVPPDDAESNFALANDNFLRPLVVPEAQIHRVRGELPPQAAASEAEGELRRFASSNSSGQPVLDLIFLGMGEEGHIASLFPGEPPEVINSPAVFRPVVASKPPPHRITLGYGALQAARHVWLLASGAGKETALGEALAGKSNTPLGRLLRMRQQTRVLTDISLPPGLTAPGSSGTSK